MDQRLLNPQPMQVRGVFAVRATIRYAFLALYLLFGLAAHAGEAPQGAAIAAAHPLATAAGYETMRRGGNAFDAAVTVSAALAVVEPYSSGLGGGGFWLLHRARDNHQVMIDARETAPGAVSLASYIDAAGKPIAGATVRGGTAVGIPGVPAGLVLLAEKYGRLPLAQTLAPAVALARDGFAIDGRYARIAKLRERFLLDGANTARTFLVDGQAPQLGYMLRQPHLSATLEILGREGQNGFYAGRVGQALIAAVNSAGGSWRAADLESYRALERMPIKFTYQGATIVTAALPSAGGLTLAQALNVLERFAPLPPPGAPAAAHLVVEALRRGFQDRALYLGDSDFVKVPQARLLSKDYARSRATGIDRNTASASEALPTEVAASTNTTHYSIVDAEGNRVAATLSINFLFGAGIVAGDTGVLLNNEMDDFSVLPDVPNAYRLRGGSANAIEPRKRPLSSMTPTFVEDERGVLVLGAPGGSRIISMVLLGILEYLGSRDVDLERIVSSARYHHQYWPDRVEIEPEGFSREWRAALEAKGHKLQATNRKWGNMQAVFKAKATGAALAANDPRGSDIAWY